MSGSIREPSFEAKMLMEAIGAEAGWLENSSDPVELAISSALKRVAHRFEGRVQVKD